MNGDNISRISKRTRVAQRPSIVYAMNPNNCDVSKTQLR